MPTREEIAAWLRQAAVEISPDGLDHRHDLFMERAASIESMRCETCAKQVTSKPFYHNSNLYLDEHCPWQDCGGCFSHEQKPAG